VLNIPAPRWNILMAPILSLRGRVGGPFGGENYVKVSLMFSPTFLMDAEP